jgi:membrane protein implicated in regulation of membrane protease activity
MFLVIGIFGALFLTAGLAFGDLLDGVLPESEWLSMTAIATWMVAFGFGGYLIDTRTGLPTAFAVVGGAAAGVALGYVALKWSRSLSTMATDATPTAADLSGRTGRVITAIPPRSTGEVLVRIGGQQVKLTAVIGADHDLPMERGAEVIVVDVLSATKVEVQAADHFWGSSS